MGIPFGADRLVERSFKSRLSSFLDEARDVLGLDAVAVIELAAVEGRVAPWLRAGSPESPSPLPCDLELFELLVSARGELTQGDPALARLGAPFSGCRVTAVPLAVSPAISVGPDALLLIAHGEPLYDTERLAELCLCLERGLSFDRRARLAEVVYQAVSQAADAIELTDSEARLVYANAAWERFFGYRFENVVGQTVGRLFRDPVAPLHDRAFYQFTLATLAEGRPWIGALACRTEDGRRVFCEAHVSPFHADAQGFRGNLAVRRDMTPRVERDQALAIAHSEFRSVLAAIPDGVAVVRDDRVYFANAAFLAMLKMTEEIVIGRAYVEFIHPDDRARFAAEQQSEVRRVRMAPAEGPPRFAEISTAGAVSFEGKPAIILLSRDTTDFLVAEEQLARSEKLSALGSLAAGVAHEINNPLAYVTLNLELVRDQAEQALAPAKLAAVDEALDGARRIRQIVAELRGFSGSDTPGPPEPIEVVKAVTSALNIAHNEIRHRAFVVREHAHDLYVKAREGQLVQVLVNVLVNAAQAIPLVDQKEHEIRIVSREGAGDRVEILVSDTGSGIPESALPHVFDAFSTGKRRGEGSGLGLTISRRIIESFAGSIRIESLVGRGTTVTIELPRAHRASASAAIVDAERQAADGARARVLIIDDEILIGRALKRILAVHEVTLVHDGRTALELLAKEPVFDVVLCDLMMPGLPGSELYRAACELKSELASRFVFMTGGAFTDVGSEFLEKLGSRVLFKPFDPARVLACVEETARKGGRSRDAEG